MDIQLLSHAQDDLIVKAQDLIVFSTVAHGRQSVTAGDLHGPIGPRPVLPGHGLDCLVRTGPLFPDFFNLLLRNLVVSLLPEGALFAVLFEGNTIGRLSQGLGKDRDRAVHVDEQGSHRIIHEIGIHLAGLEGCQHIGRGPEKEDLFDIRDLAFDQFLKGGAGDHADGLSAQVFKFRIPGLRRLCSHMHAVYGMHAVHARDQRGYRQNSRHCDQQAQACQQGGNGSFTQCFIILIFLQLSHILLQLSRHFEFIARRSL